MTTREKNSQFVIDPQHSPGNNIRFVFITRKEKQLGDVCKCAFL